MTIIDWATALTTIDGDTSGTASKLRGKISGLGLLYDLSGHPDVMTESAAHIAWRSAMAAQIAAIDRAAASVDGGPVDPGTSN